MVVCMNKEELLAALDDIEKQIGALIVKACPDVNEALAIREARVRYAEGGLWLRHWIETHV
jgi:hypothetical protein